MNYWVCATTGKTGACSSRTNWGSQSGVGALAFPISPRRQRRAVPRAGRWSNTHDLNSRRNLTGRVTLSGGRARNEHRPSKRFGEGGSARRQSRARAGWGRKTARRIRLPNAWRNAVELAGTEPGSVEGSEREVRGASAACSRASANAAIRRRSRRLHARLQCHRPDRLRG